MTYASLWSFSYFTFTLNQLLTPDTREYVYTKIWALHRSADFEISFCVIIVLQITQSYLMSAMKPCTYYGDHGWPWLTTLWEMAPRSTMVDHAFEKWHHGHGDHGWPWSSHGFWPWCHFSKRGQPWLDHGQPWSNDVFLVSSRSSSLLHSQLIHDFEVEHVVRPACVLSVSLQSTYKPSTSIGSFR